MPSYKVKLGSGDGQVLIREAQGNTKEEVDKHFRKEGYFVFSVDPVFDWASIFGFTKAIPINQFILFNKEFRGLVKAGLPIVEGFDILLKRMNESPLRSMLEDVRDMVVKGQSLSEAFAAYTSVIPRYYPALIHAGEQSGALGEVLDRFIVQEERLRKTRKKFRQAMTYPLVLLVASFLALYIILTRAMPEFTQLYTDAEESLPAITQVVMTLSNFLLNNYIEMILGGIGFVIGSFIYLRTEKGAILGERILRKIPLVGSLWFLQNQNIFARTMRLLLSGGIPVPQALAIVVGAVPSRVFAQQLKAAHGEVMKGSTLEDSLEKHTRLTDMADEMIRIGESTGMLGEMLEYVADHGEEKSSDYLELVSGLVAPIMLIVVGLMIAFLVLAMYLPMFGSYQVIN